MAFLNKGLTITLRDERRGDAELDELAESGSTAAPVAADAGRKPCKPLEKTFHYPGGLVDYIKHLNPTKDPIHPSIIGFEVKGETMEVEIAMQWNSSYNESVHSFANTINTHEGGTHEEGFRASLTSVVNKYATDKKLLKEKDDKLSGEDVREGLAAIISIRLREPQFEGQTKGKLGNTEAKSFVQKACNEWIADWFERNPGEAKTIISKAVSSSQARAAARKARDLVRRKGALEIGGLPGQAGRLPVHRSRARPSCTSWRATRPAGRRSPAGTRCSRRSCRSAARSSTWRRPGSTGCCATPRCSR